MIQRRFVPILMLALSSIPPSRALPQAALVADPDRTPVPTRPSRVQAYHIRSETLNQTRRVDILVPQSFARTGPARKYPVVVVLDGETSMRPIATVSDELSRNGMIPEMIYVGIENTDAMDGRVFDLTPPGMSVSGSNLNQGGDRFLEFLENELLPAVDRDFRGASPRFLIGHSSGGVLATYAAATRPVYRGVISIDAPVVLQQGWLISKLQARAESRSTAPLRFASYEAKFRWPEEAWARLSAAAPASWKLRHEQLRLEGHETVYSLAAYMGLRELFADYSRLASQDTPSDKQLEYYRSINATFGAPLMPPQRTLHDIVDDLVSSGSVESARAAFTLLNTGYGAQSDSADMANDIAEAARLPAPQESVQQLLATPAPSIAAASAYLGEWQGGIWMSADQPRNNNMRFRIRVEGEKVVAETNIAGAPADRAGWRPVDYLKVTERGLTWGRLNGQRPRGVMLWEGTLRGDTLSGAGRMGGVRGGLPPSVEPGFAFVRLPRPQTPAPERAPPVHSEIAPGVFLFQTARYGDAGLDGNVIAIIGDSAVLVFDANGTPAAAQLTIAEIRKLTPTPVKYLVLSHWHWDHWYGAEAYQAAFPKIEIIAQERGAQLMAGPAQEFNKPFFAKQFPDHLKAIDDQLAKLAAAPASDSARHAIEEHLKLDRWFLAQKAGVNFVKPTRLLKDKLTIDLGGRTVQVRNDGRAITPGDAQLWLGEERIAVVGDLIINPLTFGLFCYPSEWLRTLELLRDRKPAIIIPGHGLPMTDGVRLNATIALLQRELALVTALKKRGKSVKEAEDSVVADSAVLALRETLTGGNAQLRDAFRLYLVDWVVPRIFEQIDGKLDNRIPIAP